MAGGPTYHLHQVSAGFHRELSLPRYHPDKAARLRISCALRYPLAVRMKALKFQMLGCLTNNVRYVAGLHRPELLLSPTVRRNKFQASTQRPNGRGMECRKKATF